ncbi:Ecto-NOX disulfide-thiol exchanger 1 [Portunus trituberculatus]|uniref:Ecto-NOX disulfide-thiol exchanger 1 n=1 Tax=Portunus trituberculatus TaxID=210409 RepID=A0A5B7E662_PORTR|nr:Ecto-NOX disulfide-thiol exchanger 1 [Portunus trituberculatus]
MDVSDEEDMVQPPRKKMRQNEYLKEENDSLRCQMEAYKNEVDLIKADLKSEVSIRDDQIEAFKKTLQGMQQFHIASLTSTFLHIHPKGASVDYIWSFIQQFDKEIRPSDIEAMLNQYPTVYRQITTGVGACLERKWIFTGFETTV